MSVINQLLNRLILRFGIASSPTAGRFWRTVRGCAKALGNPTIGCFGSVISFAETAANMPGAIFSLLDRLKGSTTWEWTGVMGVRGDSSPASEEAQDIEPVLGLADIQEVRLPGQEPEGARPGVGIPAETGVTGASG